VPKLRSTYDGRLICKKISYEERDAFLRYDSVAKSKQFQSFAEIDLGGPRCPYHEVVSTLAVE